MVENELSLALSIAGIGMVLLFVILAVLAVIVNFLTSVMKDGDEVETQVSAESSAATVAAVEPSPPSSKALQAAAIAVVLARARARAVDSTSATMDKAGSWWLVHHSRRLSQSIRVRRSS
jgi:Na+-transporting methylmalonyl-CoA/oxaloacetate decarboxylase gamma subunit